MPAAARPDPALSAKEVLTHWLPERFAAKGRILPPDCPKLRVTVREKTGNVDLLCVASGSELSVHEDFAPEDADFWVRLTTADFHTLIHGDPDMPILVPPERDFIDLIVVDANDVDRFKQLSGRLAVEIVGKKRRRFCLDVAFGDAGFKAGRPKSTVTIDGPALEGLMNGTKAPLQALLEGRIRVDGDRALAMQAMLLAVARTRHR